MSPNRADRVESIFRDTADLPRAERPAYLNQVCAGDPGLRTEVENRLAELQETETVEIDLRRSSQSLRSGDVLQGRFCIRRFVGQGGMGEVYEADDQELGGRVALKTIRPNLLEDHEFLGRFRREVQLARQVTHPNICRMFDLGHDRRGDKERVFLTMEFLDGETLTDYLRRHGALTMEAALPLVKQMLDGLGALHEKGIVHRDFKPGNVMVVASSVGPPRAVISDFGLARALVDSSMKVSLSRTGHVMGTPDYMAPEQLLGRAITPSSDLYSLGLVMYEMLTGRKAFPGGQPVENAVQRIVEKPTPPSHHSSEISVTWNDVILRCLEREPKDRPASAADVWSRLAGSGSVPVAISRPRPKWLALPRGRTVARIGLVCALAVVAGLVGWLLRKPRAEVRIMSARRLTQVTGLHAYPSLSPDGKDVIFSSDRGDGRRLNLWKQPVAGGDAVRLTEADADDTEPTLSPNGKMLAFRSTREAGGIFSMPITGGVPRLIGPSGRGPRFSPDGEHIIYSVPDPVTGHGRAYACGAASTVMADNSDQMLREFEDVHNIAWLPAHGQVVFCGTRRSNDPAQEHDFWVANIWKGDTVKTGAFEAMKPLRVSAHSSTLTASSLQWHAGGLLFVGDSAEGNSVWHLPLTSAYRAAGPPRLVSSGIHPSTGGGRIAFSLASANSDIWALPIDPNRGVLKGAAERLTTDSAEDVMPAITADGQTIAFGSRRSDPGQMEYGAFAFSLWKLDRLTHRESAVQGAKMPFGKMKLCPAPDRAVYRFLEGVPNRKTAIYETVLATGATRRLCAECGGPTHCSADGLTIPYEVASTPVRLALLGADRSQTEILRHPQYAVRSARLSTDGWVAFHLDRNSTEKQIFVAPLRGRETIPQRDWISIAGPEGANQEAYWSPDNRLLYFLSDRDGYRCVWAQSLDPVTKRPAGAPIGVYHLHQTSFSALTSVGRGPWNVGLSIGGDRLALSLAEVKSDVWIAETSQ